jgi:hypothetical protein
MGLEKGCFNVVLSFAHRLNVMAKFDQLVLKYEIEKIICAGKRLYRASERK